MLRFIGILDKGERHSSFAVAFFGLYYSDRIKREKAKRIRKIQKIDKIDRKILLGT